MFNILLKFLFSLFYRVEVRGLENYEKAGKRVLIVANHVSFIDALLIGLFLPIKAVFAINTFSAKHWFFKPFLSHAEILPLDPTNPIATKSLIKEIKKDRTAVIFPEGRITTTGSLMKVYRGSGLIAHKADAKILPIRIEGAQYTIFSRMKGKLRLSLFPKITLTILEPQKLEIPEELKGRERNNLISTKMYDLMSDLMYTSSNKEKTLFKSLIEQCSIHGRNHIILEDIGRNPMNYGQVLTRVFVLGEKIVQKTQVGEFVGFMLPSMAGSIITFLAMQAFGRVPTMLNFSNGIQPLVSACKTAGLKNVYTSRKFVEAGNFSKHIEAIEELGVNIHYLEDIAPSVTFMNKIKALYYSYCPHKAYAKINQSQNQPQEISNFKEIDPINPHNPAVVLFTSGSEGMPKAVVLSHVNFQTNIAQLTSRIDFRANDKIFNALPIFPSFALTGGVILPLLSGTKIFLYPTPLHYRTIPELIYDTNSTIMFGTDTFLAGYARFAHAYDFYTIRYVVAGAEKLKDETRRLWSDKFGVRIFEAYGASETSPGISINTFMHNKIGSVGRVLPGIEYELEKVEGIEKGGKLIVKADNVMQAYIFPDNPTVLVPTQNSTYDTGDIVEIDEENYIFIKGRAKRFAKIAGEMISLTAVEMFISKLWEKNNHAVVSIEDSKKGEALVLVTDFSGANREALRDYARNTGLGELYVPRIIKIIEKMPLLGTGKIDYVKIKEFVNENL